MGQFESTNRTYNSNDELINALIKRECIHSINVEKVLRSVDRALYYTNDNEEDPYGDVDWQLGDVYLYSPSDYATVLECLDLHNGHKFLNIGSGIGYFSTLAGLLLGVNGVNHGIEINGSLIDIAYQKLEVFKRNSAAIDYFEFCEPVFIKGNACELMPVGYYDRVYCGADVQLEIGGVLVMPLKSVLVKVTRNSEHSWTKFHFTNVSMPDLVVAEKSSSINVSKFPTVEPLSLQELCRSYIRASIRNCLNESQPGLQMLTICKPKPNKSYDQKWFDDTKSEIIRLQNYLNEIRVLREETSDLDSTSEDEVIEEDNNGDDVDVEEKNTSEQCDKSLPNEVMNDYDTDDEIAEEFIKYRFLSNRKENELSKLLKIKINLLPVPAKLKVFLNYNRDD
ncbi:protein-L-isoaspartate O-methyltransferase domain-containing protein 1-like isoform X2 [Acyrthosiphon pisum]|uniref:Uncharacterized protein n=1 Tax=Acyrthosiphon pisum TaxID=7029 RepID=A0A8R2D6E7_ACYPI|nr:protein-L-isoaspartate O-methyltransferase domain-containing protein 1-like isoform X2 [Acyrthosiphon pisum]|eukprot:XP_016661724.1 PREDICTED: protein-L-isoaspartate O-methyltransferase domain-containing protein 1-like isoform X2 [Acyrthosiphon pisum]